MALMNFSGRDALLCGQFIDHDGLPVDDGQGDGEVFNVPRIGLEAPFPFPPSLNYAKTVPQLQEPQERIFLECLSSEYLVCRRR